MRLTRSKSCYRLTKQVGQGAYGSVFLGEDVGTGEKVALKKIDIRDQKGENQGVSITTLREISHLFRVQNENVVKLKEVVHGVQLRMRCPSPLVAIPHERFTTLFACY
jgi:serine/threonine protein kinase